MVRAYGELLQLVLRRGQLRRQLQQAVALVQREAQAQPEVAWAKVEACQRLREQLAELGQQIQVCVRPCMSMHVWESDVRRARLHAHLAMHAAAAADNTHTPQAQQAQADSQRVVGAFVTFRDEASTIACLKAHPRNRMRQWWARQQAHKLRGRCGAACARLSCACGCWQLRHARLPRLLRLRACLHARRHLLTITAAPEPSDVKFEHMEFGACCCICMRAADPCACAAACLVIGVRPLAPSPAAAAGRFSRFCRACLVVCCSYSGLAAGFVLISLASAMRFNLGRAAGISSDECNANCRLTHDAAGTLGLSDADRELYRSCAETGLRPSAIACTPGESMCYKCFCFKAITGGMIKCGGAAVHALNSCTCSSDSALPANPTPRCALLRPHCARRMRVQREPVLQRLRQPAGAAVQQPGGHRARHPAGQLAAGAHGAPADRL